VSGLGGHAAGAGGELAALQREPHRAAAAGGAGEQALGGRRGGGQRSRLGAEGLQRAGRGAQLGAEHADVGQDGRHLAPGGGQLPANDLGLAHRVRGQRVAVGDGRGARGARPHVDHRGPDQAATAADGQGGVAPEQPRVLVEQLEREQDALAGVGGGRAEVDRGDEADLLPVQPDLAAGIRPAALPVVACTATVFPCRAPTRAKTRTAAAPARAAAIERSPTRTSRHPGYAAYG
jgi:hypothetical protein